MVFEIVIRSQVEVTCAGQYLIFIFDQKKYVCSRPEKLNGAIVIHSISKMRVQQIWKEIDIYLKQPEEQGTGEMRMVHEKEDWIDYVERKRN